jgi:hypothetical protein
MFVAARRYTVVLAVIAASGAIPAAALRLVSLSWGTSWGLADTWGMIQWASIFLLMLTLPASFVWLIMAVVKQRWDSLWLLLVAFWIPLLAFFVGGLTNFKILNSG